MNEDESFIRSIVDNPGDDTPRLVYADWLDDRDDPRSSYLRAEHDWAKTRKAAGGKKLCKAGESLDAVWVARVSRPPVGVCCDHLRFTSLGGWMPAEIDKLERDIKHKLPPQYAAFLRNYSGSFWLPAWIANDHPDFYPRIMDPREFNESLRSGNDYFAAFACRDDEDIEDVILIGLSGAVADLVYYQHDLIITRSEKGDSEIESESPVSVEGYGTTADGNLASYLLTVRPYPPLPSGPEVGEEYRYYPPNRRTHKIADKGIKVEVIAVDATAQTVTLKNVANPRSQYRAVPWTALQELCWDD